MEFGCVHVKRNFLVGLGSGEVRFGVTRQAVAVGRSLVVKNLSDVVGGVTVNTYGDLIRILFPQFPTNNFSVHFFDPAVTALAGFRDIVPVYTRPGVSMG